MRREDKWREERMSEGEREEHEGGRGGRKRTKGDKYIAQSKYSPIPMPTHVTCQASYHMISHDHVT